jgi:hypothetical protein
MEIPATIIVNNQPVVVNVIVILPEQYQGKCQVTTHPTFLYKEDDIVSPIDVDNVYLIKAGESKRYKIGHTRRKPSERVAELQTGNHERLSLIATCPGGEPVEKALHTRFLGKRGLGEWFEFSDEDLSAVIGIFTSYRSQMQVSTTSSPASPVPIAARSTGRASTSTPTPPPAIHHSPIYLENTTDFDESFSIKRYLGKVCKTYVHPDGSPDYDRIFAHFLMGQYTSQNFRAYRDLSNDIRMNVNNFKEAAKVILCTHTVYKYNSKFIMEILNLVYLGECVHEILHHFKQLSSFKPIHLARLKNVYSHLSNIKSTPSLKTLVQTVRDFCAAIHARLIDRYMKKTRYTDKDVVAISILEHPYLLRSETKCAAYKNLRKKITSYLQSPC